MKRLPLTISAIVMLRAAAGFAGAEEPKPAPPTVSTQTQKINELIAKGWAAAGIEKPADKANDFEFMRRAFIDLIGRIPTPEEIYDFEFDKSLNKRAKLINRLLNEEKYKLKDRSGRPVVAIAGLKTQKGEIDYNRAYAENFAELWTTWMLTRSNTNSQYRERLNSWLVSSLANHGSMSVTQDGKTVKVEYHNGAPWDQIVSHLISETGKSSDVGAVVFVARHLGEPIVAETKQQSDFAKDGKFDAVPITSRVTRLFLGIRTQCMQCHNHPFNAEYVQADFWGVNAFFRQTDRSGTTNPDNGGAPPLTLSDVGSWNQDGMVLYERRDGQRKASFPVMLKDLANGQSSTKRLVPWSIPTGLESKTRRQVLAQWVTEHDNFSRAFVNRMWGHLFGHGLNREPTVDDFSSNSEVVHPELLDYLASEFRKYNYNPKKLLEWICTSDVYQLSHVANPAYVDQKFEPFFARMPLKALSPEVMFESLAVATRARTRKDDWIAKLTQNFGDDEGNEINFNGTIVQALLMMNGKEINGEIGTRDTGVVADVVTRHLLRPGGTVTDIYDELFLMALGRHITTVELDKLEQVRQGKAAVYLEPPSPGTKPQKEPPTSGIAQVKSGYGDETAYFQDVFWALLNSNAFMLNH